MRAWLLGTPAGWLLGGGALLKLLAYLGALVFDAASAFGAVDTVGDLTLLAGVVFAAYRLLTGLRQHLLWRVRRKLVLSYVFIGVVPVLLVAAFFMLGGLLFFFNVSAYLLRARVEALVEAAELLAVSTVPGLEAAADQPAAVTALVLRQSQAVTPYPGVSYALVPAAGACGSAGRQFEAAVGPWAHGEAPRVVPGWVPCEGTSRLVAHVDQEGTTVMARAVAWPPGIDAALVVDIPFGDVLVRSVAEEMGLTISQMLALDAVRANNGAGPSDAPRTRAALQQPEGLLGWVAFLDYTDWPTGETHALTVGFRVGAAAVYRYLSGASLGGPDNVNVGQVLLALLAVVGGLFLVIQTVAFLMGLTLARSITGAVHELFAGTERVRQGDFSHTIPIHSRDQLGELAQSFNEMTASVTELMRTKSEKERLEQELRVARGIQMSLLPQGALRVPGVALTGHCEPAREVGGDYYDFLPLEDGRLGILIADVAGKGTSAALYMAELKGLMLSLSQQHVSPRALLVDANRIISRHLDARSFITMTYAVLDPRAHTLTFARAGHCPLVHVPAGATGARTAQALAPSGMVLGLQLDLGDHFERLLEEVTVPCARGDLFLFYTDGISEAMDGSGDCFGDTRLMALAEQHAGLPSQELRERILRDIEAFAAGTPQHDDMTMVVLQIEDL